MKENQRARAEPFLVAFVVCFCFCVRMNCIVILYWFETIMPTHKVKKKYIVTEKYRTIQQKSIHLKGKTQPKHICVCRFNQSIR